VKKLFRWSDKRYNKEYWKRLEQNWKQWKGKRRRQTLETIKEEEKTEQKNSEIRDWTKKDEEEISNMVDPYYEL